jgi:hypothetical protein
MCFLSTHISMMNDLLTILTSHFNFLLKI